MDDDNWTRERELDKRYEQEPAHMHRAPVRVFFFESIGPALADPKPVIDVESVEKPWRPSDGAGS